MKAFTVLILGACIAMTLPAQAQSREEKKAGRAEAVAKALDARTFKVGVDYMIPRRGKSRALTSPYSVEVRGDSICSCLPYVGRGFNVPYGGGQGLNFSAAISQYEDEEGKKGRRLITIKVRSDEDSYTYRLTVYPDGQASLNVQPTERESISYRGELEY